MAVNLIRICGALLIFLCHACSESGSAIGGILGQFFNVGVPVFFVLSGYLHSLKAAPIHTVKWYAKKLQRLMVPLYIFLAILAVIYFIAGYSINWAVWLQSVIPVCGLTENYISGCGQLWFLTHLLVCYLVTPLLQRNRVNLSLWKLALLWGVVAILLAYMVPPIWCTLWNSFFNYCVGFYVIPRLLKKQHHDIALMGSALFACGLRLVFRAIVDDTPLYNTVATEVCSIVLACSIFVFFYQMGESTERKASVFICEALSIISKRTYEFYLSHYIFLNGNLRIKVVENVWVDAILSFALAVILAEIIYEVKSAIETGTRKMCSH